MLTVLGQAEGAGGRGARRGDTDFTPMDNFRRFDEPLYRTPQGYFFIMRPLGPEEAEAWIIAHGDEPLARQLFPAEG